MSGFSLLSSFARLSVIAPFKPTIRSITTYKPLQFRITQCLCAEPLKKKKKMDPAIIRQREERKKRKIEKQIRRLEKHSSQLKNLEEVEVPYQLVEDKEKRTRPMVVHSPAIVEARALLEKTWARALMIERVRDIKNIDRMVTSQRRALEALRQESEELYEEAIIVDIGLVPYNGKGPVATPPIKDYDSPDGEYIDISKNWDF